MKTEVVYASEMEDLVERIALIRDPDLKKKRAEERAALRRYERARGDRPEVGTSDEFMGMKLPGSEKRGFTKTLAGQEVLIERPRLHRSRGYMYMPYSRAGFTINAQQYGILPNGILNRDIRNERVKEYAAIMESGNWHDLLSDPIAITEDGHVVNGQHRIAAATQLDWEGERGPAFLVVWGVNPVEAMYADGSRRTDRDQKTIFGKVTKAVAEGL